MLCLVPLNLCGIVYVRQEPECSLIFERRVEATSKHWESIVAAGDIVIIPCEMFFFGSTIFSPIHATRVEYKPIATVGVFPLLCCHFCRSEANVCERGRPKSQFSRPLANYASPLAVINADHYATFLVAI